MSKKLFFIHFSFSNLKKQNPNHQEILKNKKADYLK